MSNKILDFRIIHNMDDSINDIKNDYDFYGFGFEAETTEGDARFAVRLEKDFTKEEFEKALRLLNMHSKNIVRENETLIWDNKTLGGRELKIRQEPKP